jgi:hypothetical protein
MVGGGSQIGLVFSGKNKTWSRRESWTRGGLPLYPLDGTAFKKAGIPHLECVMTRQKGYKKS